MIRSSSRDALLRVIKMLRTFYAMSFLSCVSILHHDSSDENVNSYNVTTLGKRGKLCILARQFAISLAIMQREYSYYRW